MYNEERKREFLRERKDSAVIGSNTESGFIASEYYENFYGKDLAEWTSSEIVGFFKYFNTTKIQTLIMLKSCFQIYTDWCLNNGLIKDNQNHYSEISSSDLCRCININKLKETTYTRSQLLEGISCLPNYCDRFLFLGIFEGIPTRGNELYEVSRDHKGEILVLGNGEKIKISRELQDIIYFAGNETERIRNHKSPDPYIQTDKIIRFTTSFPSGNISMMVGRRFRSALKTMGFSPGTTQRDIAESGRLEFIRNYMEANGVEKDDAIDICCRDTVNTFGTVQNIQLYKEIYGRLI